jgi:hypothetical protein
VRFAVTRLATFRQGLRELGYVEVSVALSEPRRMKMCFALV